MCWWWWWWWWWWLWLGETAEYLTRLVCMPQRRQAGADYGIPSAFVAQEPAPGTQERVSCDSGARFCDSRAGLSDSKSLAVSQERVSLTQELVSVTQERASVTQGFVLAFQARFSSNSRARFCESGVSCGSDRGSHAGRVAAGTPRKQRETHAMHTRDPEAQQTT